ncbi:MAG: TonB-dependent receptor [Bacteroidales bacterium]|nr:TonB-dependent receptor [Bacteroidales bacterium]
MVLLAVLGFALGSYAQRTTVTGTVRDRGGEPMAGAAVAVQSTSQGVITDIDGKYSIQVNPDAVLEFSFIGYVTQTAAVGGRSVIDIVLEEESNLLTETVVVGYGIQKKVNLTGAVASVDYAEVSKSRPLTNTAQGLVGASAGVNVTQTSGQPGVEGINIRIRGVGTLNDAAPLVIVDGFESSLSRVAPDDIASISILKDAASCAIYGNRGANGVILVTTKDGSAEGGKVSVTYSGIASYNQPLNYFHVITDYADYMAIMNESCENIGNAPLFSQASIDLWREKSQNPNEISASGYPNYVAYPNTDWMKALFKKDIYQKHNISVRGAEGKTRYLLSASFMDNPGVIMKTSYDEFSFRVNLSSQITKWLEIGTRIYGTKGHRQLSAVDSAFDYLSRAVPGIYPYYDGHYGWMENAEQSTNSRNNLYFIDRNGGNSDTTDMTEAFFANVKLPFGIVNNFTYNNWQRSTWYKYYTHFLNAYSFRKGQDEYIYNDLAKGTITHKGADYNRWTVQDNLSWTKTIAKKHDVSAMAGFEATYYRYRNLTAKKTEMTDYDLLQLDNVITPSETSGTTTDYSAASFFGRVNYAYDSRYLFEANLRYDGSSRFSRQTRWGLFPSVSGAWRISQEPWMKGRGIDNLKLRASWGRLGNNAIGNYEYVATYATGYTYSLGGRQVAGIVSSINNDTLTWETTTTTNLGIDFATLGNRLTVEVDAYDRLTDGILYKAPIYSTIGNKSAPYQNLCEVDNKGVELTVGWRNDVGDFHYGVSANFTRNWNVVSKYKGALVQGWQTDDEGNRVYVTNIGDVSTTLSSTRKVMEGKLINEFYLLNVYSGDGSHFYSDGTVNPDGGPVDGMIRTPEDMAWLEAMVDGGAIFLPNKTVDKKNIWYGDYIYADENGDGIYGSSYDYTFQGASMTPKYYYGFQFDASWKGIDFSMNLAGAGGHKVYWRYLGFNCYSTRGDTTLPLDIAYDHYFYDPDNPSDPRTNTTSKHGRLTCNYGGEQNGGGVYTNHWLYRGDFLKIKNITLGYTFPERLTKKFAMQDLRVYFSGENLYTFTKFPGMDPEFSDTMNYYSQLRQLSLGVSVKF